MRTREERQLVAGLPAFLEELARALRAGASMRVAVTEAARRSDGALRPDLDRLVTRLEHGVPLGAALDEWTELRERVRLVRVVAVALVLAAEVGGSVAQAVDGVADTIRTELALHAEVRSLAAQAQASAVLVALLPAAFALVAGLLDGRTIAFLVASRAGLACLGCGLVLNVAGFAWMARISRPVV